MTDHYAVIGNPIAQSKSPAIHLAFAEQTGQDLEYGRLEAPPDGFAEAATAFRRAGGRGMNVTAPFKLDAFRYASDVRERAQLAGAANCLRFDGDTVTADNFDGIGLLRDIETNLGTPVRGRRVLMLGAGGAVRGALLPFLEAGPSELVVANRTALKAETLAEAFGTSGNLTAAGLERLAGMGRFDLVLNATSASLLDQAPAVPDSAFGPGALAYDLTYGKGLTPFLRLAQAAGVTRLHDGVGMLVEQAAEAFAWWRGVRPQTAPVIQRLTVPLA